MVFLIGFVLDGAFPVDQRLQAKQLAGLVFISEPLRTKHSSTLGSPALPLGAALFLTPLRLVYTAD